MATVESVAAALANAPPATPDLDRKIALGRLKQRLFAREAAVTLGRYHLLERVGKGGMGVVWGAWDPELERRVAIKLLVPTIPEARERMLLEGQALAKLSHPNVVPIYDVGVIDEQVYLVMEWVRGESLRAFAASPRSVRELVAVYRQAGEGLAAAHRAGLVHRDFKPDNAIRGEDGRVRILDFGLARGEVTAPELASAAGERSPSAASPALPPPAAPASSPPPPAAAASPSPATRGAGTPRYMAPEQRSGVALTAAADQFAFCTSLREALLARRGEARGPAPIPRWLLALLERGAAEAPSHRFPDMAALLSALDREVTRRWQRRALIAAAAAAALAAFAFGKSRGGDDLDPCSGATAELSAAWSPEGRSALAAHLAALGAYGGEQAPRVTAALDGAAAGWVRAHRQACVAHRRDELTSELYQRRLGCLARTKVALGTVAELLTATSRDGLDNALVAARSLPDATRCAEQDATSLPPPPAQVAPRLPAITAQIERARILAVALRPDATVIGGAAVAAAEGTEYGPVIARASLVAGRTAASLSRWDDATSALRRAIDVAVESGDDEAAVEAFARLVFVASRRGVPVDGASIVEPLARRTAAPGRFARALLYNNLATAELARADRAAARRWLLQAQRELDTGHGELDLELVSVAQNLALVADEPAERSRRASAVVELLSRQLGANHGRTLVARVVEGNETRDLAAALARFTDTCARYRQFQPHLRAAMALCHYRLGWLADEHGDLEQAREAMQRAITEGNAEDLAGQVATFYLRAMPPPPVAPGKAPDSAALAREAPARRAALTSLLALAERHAADPQFWKRLVAVDAQIAAALVLERSGQPAPARRAWRRALEIGEPLDPPQMWRRLARVRAALAD